MERQRKEKREEQESAEAIQWTKNRKISQSQKFTKHEIWVTDPSLPM